LKMKWKNDLLEDLSRHYHIEPEILGSAGNFKYDILL
jgi:hypothetical protein